MPVVNAVAHAYNMSAANAVGPAGAMVRQAFYGIHSAYNPPELQLTEEAFCIDQSAELLARTHFRESDVDVLVYHTLRVDSLFADGLCAFDKAVELADRWPDRVVTYLGLDPTLGVERTLADLEDQHRKLPSAVGVKLYPDQLEPYRTFRMDDAELMWPVYRRAAELGIRVIAVHKALPNGPVPLAPYRIDDVEGAAMAFPELGFEIVHSGMAFVTETALAIARFPNVWANLEVTTLLLWKAPHRFAEILAELVHWAGTGKILYSDGALLTHPQRTLERMAAFRFPDEVLERWAIPQLTDADLAAVLGGNYARMTGLDLTAVTPATDGRDGVDPPYTAWRELTGGEVLRA
jgi:hypothetical protein